MTNTLERLRSRVQKLESELAEAKRELRDLERASSSSTELPLSLPEYRRYGRQMILDGFGLDCQLKLKNASVLVIGAGGLGCPALQYLAAAGVGKLGIVDHDTVEVSNLQRQILHTDSRVGWLKADSAKAALSEINPFVTVTTYPVLFHSTNAISIMEPYSLVLDCTDNPSTRYLISDTSRALGIPLVSGAAMRYDGQLVVYNRGEQGPCYRCVYPTPPKPEAVGTCEDVGVLGVVTGIVGTLQAMEAIKILIEKDAGHQSPPPTMLLFSMQSTTPFRTIKLRPRRATCSTCSLSSDELYAIIPQTDYVTFCGGVGENARISGERVGEGRISVEDFKVLQAKSILDKSVRLIDVRPEIEYGICAIPGCINIPLSKLKSSGPSSGPPAVTPLRGLLNDLALDPDIKEVLFLCKQGNDSQLAASLLRAAHSGSPSESGGVRIRDVRGGLVAWNREVDPGFPIY